MGIFRQFPYTNFHELNLDELIKIMREMQDEWSSTKTEWASYKDFIDNYFARLDVSQEVLAALRIFAADGTLKTIMDPTIATETAAWLTQHITPTTPPVDASLSIAGAAADAKVAGDNIRLNRKNLYDYNMFDILGANANYNSNTHNGVTFSWNDGVLTLTGTASPAAFNNIYNNIHELPEGVEPGDTISFTWLDEKSRFQAIWYDANGTQIINQSSYGYTAFKVPENAAGLILRIYVPSGNSVNVTAKPELLNIGYNYNIKYLGVIVTNGFNYDNAPINSVMICNGTEAGAPINAGGVLITLGNISRFQIYIVMSNGRTYYRRATMNGVDYTYDNWTDQLQTNAFYGGYFQFRSGCYNEDLDTADPNTIVINCGNAQNAPRSGAGYCLTMGTIGTGGTRIQIYYDFNTGAQYYRHSLALVWSEWTSASASGGNDKASMYSVGNSILSGSVWTSSEGSDTLAAYGNAPYSVVANSIGIPKEKVEHVLLSSTGLLFDSGRGNFLENIKSKDISNVDVVFTHMWIQDMANYQMGSLNSTKNDGTIAGAVLELLDYLKTNNKRTQLILCSVPPCSTTIKGDNVFTGIYANGNSIEDLDELMHELAAREKFKYIDFEDMNISYYWQDLTWNHNNVHLASEDSYRLVGAHLGGQASSLIHF